MPRSPVNSSPSQRKGKMNKVAGSDQGGTKGATVIPLQKDELAELKRLLLSQEQSQILQILQRLDDPDTRASEISRILPDTIVRRAAQDAKLVPALMSTVEQILKDSVKKDPKTLADSLFPIMGPAIRKSVAEFVRAMVQSMNHTLERGLSPQGLKWRIESYRTGKPFAEIVLLHSLVFRVEQIFLIHKETGLLLSHMTAESVIVQDPDMVSAMLTAIQDFVRDSFHTKHSDELENLQLGDLTVVVEQGPLAYVAAVIRGTAPEELRISFKEAAENIHLELGPALEAFDGDAAPFEAAEFQLHQCLQDRYKTGTKKTFPYVTTGLIVILAALGVWMFFEYKSGLRWKHYIDELRGEKGIVVVSTDRRSGKYEVSGLRDPLATDPGTLVNKSGLEPGEVSERWEGFQAVEPEFVLARARAALKPPDSVMLTLDNGVLSAGGTAPYQWIVDARKLAGLIPGIREYQDNDLKVNDVSLLQQVTRVLNPPKTVTLKIDKGILSATGTAPHSWILEARRLVTLVPGVAGYRDSDLSLNYDLVLQRLRTMLDPPDTVKLTIKDGIVSADGSAPYQWIEDTRKLIRLVPGVKGYRDKDLRVNYDRVLERIRKVLAPPDTVSLKIVDGVLEASGSAPHQWIVDARRSVRGFHEITGYQDRELTDLDRARFNALKSSIDKTSLHFVRNTDRLVPGQEKSISHLVTQLRSLQRLARVLDKAVYIDIKGHTDATGSGPSNLALSDRRARKIAALLAAEGVRQVDLSPRGVASHEPLATGQSQEEQARNRRVSVAVVVEDNPRGRGRQ